MDVNKLYYGDNLDILRRYVEDESVDLVYLDPPFQSGRDYNVLFERHNDTKAAAQIKAFEDTWRWSLEAERAYQETVEQGGDLSRAMQAFRTLLGASDMMAYLCMMAPRLMELRRVLKPNGSIYLHCDPTASHYLKLLLDAVFEPRFFRNEIVWLRSLAKGLASRRLPNSHDLILNFQRQSESTWNPAYAAYNLEELDDKTLSKYSSIDSQGRRFQMTSLINPSNDRPNLTYEFLGVTKVWRWTKERMQREFSAGKVVQSKPGTVPRFKRYLDEQKGKPIGDVWIDIPPVNSRAAERLGYPTQKPLALLERIIEGASNPGDVVLDPFCGCGTAVHAAQKLGRSWIGIDITCLATNLIKSRMKDAFGLDLGIAHGEPVSEAEARNLAEEEEDGRFQFQCWALGFVGARAHKTKRGADGGVDGRLYFHEGQRGGETKQIIFSVKSGKLKADDIRSLSHVVAREKAQIGVLITLEDPSKPMVVEAAQAGFYQSPWGKHPKLQILTIKQLLEGKRVDYPVAQYSNVTLRKAPTEPLKSASEGSGRN